MKGIPMKTRKTNLFPLEIRASKTRQVPANFQLVGNVEVHAAEDNKSEARPRFTLKANTGKPMDLAGFFDPVVIDLAGAKFDKKITPVIMDHDTSKRIGATLEQLIVPAGGEAVLGGKSIKGPVIAATGEVRSKMGVAQGFVDDSRDGFPFQVSVGASILPGGAEFYGEDEKVEVNGRTFKGPLIVARKTVIRELSVTVLGADNDTSAKVAATAALNPQQQEGKGTEMDFESYVKSLGLDPATLTDEQRAGLKAQWESNVKTGGGSNLAATQTAATQTIPAQNGDDDERKRLTRLAAQERRVDGIRAAFQRYPGVKKVKVDDKEVEVTDFKASAISNPDTSINDVELVLLRAERDSSPTTGSGPAIHAVQQVREMEPSVLSCALLRQFPGSIKASAEHKWTGEKWGWEHWFPENVLEASDHRDLRNLGLHQLMNLQVIAATGQPWIGSDKKDLVAKCREAIKTIKASSGFSSLDVTNIFDDVANKLLLAGYQSVNTTWQEWARPVNVNDFKTHNFYRLTSTGAYEPVGADGELKHGGFSEDKYTVAADTYGKIYGLTRHHLINDDLGAFESLMAGLGQEGGKTVEELVYVHLLNNLATLFPSDGSENNYISGASTVLSIDGLSEAQQAFEDQTIDNAPLLIEPDRILVGTQDRVTAGQLFNDTEIRPQTPTSGSAAKTFIRNPHQSAFRPIVSGYLNNTAIKQRVRSKGTAIPGQSSTQWFMFGNPMMPQGAVVMVAFLNGNRTPFLESSDASFDVLGMQWRAYHDVGTGSGEPKLGVMSKGAA